MDWQRPKGERPTLQVSFWDQRLGERKEESIILDFHPTTIGGLEGDPDRILLGAIEANGAVALLEYRFDFSEGVPLELEVQVYGNVSMLSTISAIEIFQEKAQEVIYVLDGVSGEFGRLRKGGEYISLTRLAQSKQLLGCTKILSNSSHPPARTFWFRKTKSLNPSTSKIAWGPSFLR